MDMLGEKIIDRTSFAVSIPLKLERTTGLMRIDGRVQGQINGTIIGEVHGYVRGEASLFVNMGKMEQQEDDGSSLEAFIQKEKEEKNA